MSTSFNPQAGGFPNTFNAGQKQNNPLYSLGLRSAAAMNKGANASEAGVHHSNNPAKTNPLGDISSFMDSFNPSIASEGGFTYSKSQFSFQQSTMEYMETDNGFTYYQKDISIEIVSEKFQAGSIDEEALGELTDYFSPENTANRITNLATSFFPLYAQQNSLEDTPENRQSFVDFITPSIDKGYEQALGDLGELPEDIAGELQKTIDLVKESLSLFAKGEEAGYHEKIQSMIGEQFNGMDTDQDGLLNLEESSLSKERFTQLDTDEDGLVSTDEVASLIEELDVMKDLDSSLALSILDPSATPQGLAQQAKDLLSPQNRISMETLSINIVVSETIIEYTQEPGEADLREGFAQYLDKDEKVQDEVNSKPESIKDHLLEYKMESVLQQLESLNDVFKDFTKDFFKEHNDKLDFLFKNPQMADFFGENPESAQNFIK